MEFNFNFFFALLMTAFVFVAYYAYHKIKTKEDIYLKPWQLVIVFLLSYPWRFGDNVWSLFGGESKTGSVSSLCAIYQDAKHNAGSVIGINLFQKAGGKAVQGAGIIVYQQGAELVTMGLGISCYQHADSKAKGLISLIGYQQACEFDNWFLTIPIVQKRNSSERCFSSR